MPTLLACVCQIEIRADMIPSSNLANMYIFMGNNQNVEFQLEALWQPMQFI